jgi:hypothetical protein
MNNEDITHGKLIEILKEMNELGCSAIVQDEKGRLSRIKEVKQTEEGLFIMTELVVEWERPNASCKESTHRG